MGPQSCPGHHHGFCSVPGLCPVCHPGAQVQPKPSGPLALKRKPKHFPLRPQPRRPVPPRPPTSPPAPPPRPCPSPSSPPAPPSPPSPASPWHFTLRLQGALPRDAHLSQLCGSQLPKDFRMLETKHHTALREPTRVARPGRARSQPALGPRPCVWEGRWWGARWRVTRRGPSRASLSTTSQEGPPIPRLATTGDTAGCHSQAVGSRC